MNFVDPSGCFPILTIILCGLATIGMGLTIGGVASENTILTATGLGLTGVAFIGVGVLALDRKSVV